MCGIYGYVGQKESNAALLTYRGLRDLEYRGYDSWGIAVPARSGLVVRKSVGKISDASLGDLSEMKGRMAIGHSRWATHGKVTETNTHPHVNSDNTIAVIHNGIVENHAELRAFLASEFHKKESELFVSETDTEVIPHLIDHFMTHAGLSFEDAFTKTGALLEGRYAIVAMHADAPYLLAMRKGSPLVIGKGEREFILASDVTALLDRTKTVCYLGDAEYVRLNDEHCVVRDLVSGKKIEPVWQIIPWDKSSATKEGYPHFMLKEIMEEGHALDAAIRQDDVRLTELADMLRTKDNIFFIGCGTAAKMAKIGELYMARIAGKFTPAFTGSEFAPYRQFLNSRDSLVAVSQSGETADILDALERSKKEGVQIAALLNVVGSSIDRLSKKSLYLHVGPEIAVASTKAAVAQIALLFLLAHTLKRSLPEGKHLLRKLVREVNKWLTTDLVQDIRVIAEKIVRENDVYIIGRGLHAPIALEAAIKIQEVAYIHAEGFPGGELKHGPIALIREGTPCIAFLPNDETARDMESNITELKSRGAFIVGIAPAPHSLFDEWIKTPDVGDVSPIVSLIPIQLLAYHLAVLRGNDPDMPRNLAKSVTVK